MNRVHMTDDAFDAQATHLRVVWGGFRISSHNCINLSESDAATTHRMNTCLHRGDILESSAGPHEVHVHPYAIQHFQLVWTGNPEPQAISAAVDSRPQEI